MTSIQSAKLGMTPDAFLYACIQSDEARRKKDGAFNSHLRYEPFLFGTYRAPKARTLEAFANDLHSILQHHWVANPQFRRGEAINTETISYFSQAVPTVFADIEDLTRLFFGRSLPMLIKPEDASDISDEFPALENAISRFQAYNDSLTEDSEAYNPAAECDDANAEASAFSNELWYVISELTKEIFGEYTGALLGFVNWKFAPKEEDVAIDWRITPPVGAAYIKWRKSLDPDFGKPPHLRRGNRDDKRSDRKDDRGDKGESESPGVSAKARPRMEPGAELTLTLEPTKPKSDAPKAAPKQEESDHKPHNRHAEQSSHQRSAQGDRKFDKRDRDGRKPSRNHDNAPRQSSEEQVETGLAEARAAMEQLKNDGSLKEVALAPANSFIRRAQHALIVEMGFDTESRGEGRDRCVHVLRGQ